MIILILKLAFEIIISCSIPIFAERESSEAKKLQSLPSTASFKTAVSGIIMGLTFKLWAAMGAIIKFFESGVTIGPPTLNAYAVDPEGVEIINPSAQYAFKKSPLIHTCMVISEELVFWMVHSLNAREIHQRNFCRFEFVKHFSLRFDNFLARDIQLPPLFHCWIYLPKIQVCQN